MHFSNVFFVHCFKCAFYAMLRYASGLTSGAGFCGSAGLVFIKPDVIALRYQSPDDK